MSKEAMKAAVEALEPFAKLLVQVANRDLVDHANVDCQVSVSDMRRAHSALSLLRAALEGGEEPVAWMTEAACSSPVVTDAFLKQYPQWRSTYTIPLYASPIAADTLRDAEPIGWACYTEEHGDEPRVVYWQKDEPTYESIDGHRYTKKTPLYAAMKEKTNA